MTGIVTQTSRFPQTDFCLDYSLSFRKTSSFDSTGNLMSCKGALITALNKLFCSLIIIIAKIFVLENRHYFACGLPEHSPVQ